MPAVDPDDAAAEAGKLAVKIGSATVDAVSFMAELGEELPWLGSALKTLRITREKIADVRSVPEEVQALCERCTYLTACVAVKFRRNPSSEVDVTPLEDCVENVKGFVDRYSQRRKASRLFKASSDKTEIARMNARLDRLTANLSLVGIATVEQKVDAIMVRHSLRTRT